MKHVIRGKSMEDWVARTLICLFETGQGAFEIQKHFSVEAAHRQFEDILKVWCCRLGQHCWLEDREGNILRSMTCEAERIHDL